MPLICAVRTWHSFKFSVTSSACLYVSSFTTKVAIVLWVAVTIAWTSGDTGAGLGQAGEGEGNEPDTEVAFEWVC